MELIWKTAAASVLAAVVSLMLKKHNPETALLLGAITAVCIAVSALGLLSGFAELRAQARQMLGSESEVLLAPVLKCLAISIVTRLTAELCRDASQQAAAAAVDLAGTACSVAVVLPLLMSVLKKIGGLS